MSHPSLFDPPKLPEPFDAPVPVRKRDPETSAIAARSMRDSGKASAHRLVVLRLVQANEGGTYQELFAAQPEPKAIDNPVEIMRRLGDLTKLRYVMKGVERCCRVNGNRMTTWFITEHGREALNVSR